MTRYELQVTDYAFTSDADAERAGAFHVASRHTSVLALRRAYRRAWRWRHPQQHCWTGNVQIVRESDRRIMLLEHGDLHATEHESLEY